MSAGQRGAAAAETAGVTVLVAAATLAALALIAAEPPERASREVASAIGRKIRCAAAAPNLAGGRGPCWRDPLTLAYGRALAGAVRALAPAPVARSQAGGPALVPVSFRHCRSVSCAVPTERPGLTASNRLVTLYTSVRDRRRSGGPVVIEYWHYRPSQPWELRALSAGSDEVRELASTPLPDDAVPRLIPLETLSGRDHVRFAPGEEPPWRWRVESIVPP